MSISMENKGFVRLMLLFLGFSYLLLSCTAVPITRSLLKSGNEHSSSIQDLHAQDVIILKLNEAEKLYGEEEERFNGERMLMEITDYPQPGSNPRHDPKVPPTGRA